jgi:hypothetical protein
MSEQEREALHVELKAANMPLVKSVIVGSLSVIGAIVGGSMYVGNVLHDVKDLKQFKTASEPKIELHDKQIAIINFKLGIK